MTDPGDKTRDVPAVGDSSGTSGTGSDPAGVSQPFTAEQLALIDRIVVARQKQHRSGSGGDSGQPTEGPPQDPLPQTSSSPSGENVRGCGC